MRSAPSTPNAGSSLVASTIGAGDGVGVTEEDAFEGAVLEGDRVRVTLKTVGTRVVTGKFWPWDTIAEVTLTELVVSTKERVWEGDGCAEDWAKTACADK
jgi:hypothetical protein